jgi:thioredoxin-like negative regulator of GroEL
MKKMMVLLILSLNASLSFAQMQELSQDDFFEKVVNIYESDYPAYKGDKPCMVLFYSPYCAYSKQMEKNINQVAKRHKGGIYFYKINVFNIDDSLMEKMQIQGVPSLGVFEVDDVIDEDFETYPGVAPIDELEEIMEEIAEEL